MPGFSSAAQEAKANREMINKVNKIVSGKSEGRQILEENKSKSSADSNKGLKKSKSKRNEEEVNAYLDHLDDDNISGIEEEPNHSIEMKNNLISESIL